MKGRSNQTYANKKRRITKWYSHMENNRQPKNGKGKDKKELKPLPFFIDKLKKPNITKRSKISDYKV